MLIPRLTEIVGRAYAKVNLTLEVLDRRPDGYHNLRSVMIPVKIWDNVRARFGEPGIRVACEPKSRGEEMPQDEGNLAGKAARAFFEATGLPAALHLRIQKGIPSQAGLGGGSSDAACALAFLNRAWGDPLSLAEMEAMAAGLGSDVPFFLAGSGALVEGRGEIVTPIACHRQVWLLVIKPGVSVSTARAYEQWAKSPTPSVQDRSAAMLRALRTRSVEAMSAALHNDLQPLMVRRYREVEACLDGLSFVGAVGCLMAGSGSAVFGLARNAEHCRTMLDRLPGDARQGVAWTTSRAPAGQEIVREHA